MSDQPPASGKDQQVPESTSPSLLQRAQVFDPEAWERLVVLYSPLVWSWCRRFQLPEADAEDVMQEVFRAVHRRIGAFRRDRPGDSFRGWLWTITRNKVHDHFRRQAGKPAPKGGTEAHVRLMQLPEAEPPSESAGPGSGKSSSLFRRGLELVRAEFEERTWQAFWRATIDEQPTSEIAADLGMSPGAVRKAKFRVLHRLRDEYQDLIE